MTDRLARIGVTVSTCASESNGLACLGTIIVDPGNISERSKGMKGRTGRLMPLCCLEDIPLGSRA